MRRLKNRSIRELGDRGRQALRITMERANLVVHPRPPSGCPLMPALPFAVADAAESSYDQRSTERTHLIAVAEAAVQGRFDLLGFQSLDFGSPINWCLDPTRGRQAPLLHWSRVPYLDETVVGDHKIIWELNRHQWLVTVAQAWRLTGEPRYLAFLAETLDRWLRANPPRMGINWASSLELAFRAIAWSWVLHLTAGAFPDHRGLHGRLLDSLAVHGDQIDHHLSTWFSPNTHLTGEALGLLYLGCGWPQLPRAGRWRTKGWKILCEQLTVQVRPDGTYFEQTSWYQGYTVDFYLHALILARANGLAIDPGMESRIAEAAKVIAELMRPDGTMPLIGDDDGGRLLPLVVRRTDFRDTLALARVVLPGHDCGPRREVPAATAWICGGDRWRELDAESVSEAPAGSCAFGGGGWYLLRGRDGSMVVDAGPHGALAGGHSHADALAIDLTVGGHAVVADPGTGAYVGAWRDAFRATTAHSTLTLAGGIGSAEPAGMFRWGRWPQVTVRHWSREPGWAAFEAEHDGFVGPGQGPIHRRTVVFLEGWGWLVLDRLLGSDADATVRFQVGAGLEVLPADGSFSIHPRGGQPLVWIVPDRGEVLKSSSGLISTCYGVAGPAPAVVRTMIRRDDPTGCATLVATTEGSRLHRGRHPGEWFWHVPHVAEPAHLEVDGNGTARFFAAALAVVFD